MITPLYLHAIRRYWLLVTVVSLCGGALAFGLDVTGKPVYRAETTIEVSFTPSALPEPDAEASPSGPSPSPSAVAATEAGPSPQAEAQLIRRLKQRQVKTFSGVARSAEVTTPVIESLELPYTPAELAKHITSWSPVDTFLIEIVVLDADRHRASNISNALGEELSRFVESQMQDPELAARAHLKVRVPASAPIAPVRHSGLPQLGLGLIAGFAFAVGVATVLLTRRERVQEDRR